MPARATTVTRSFLIYATLVAQLPYTWYDGAYYTPLGRFSRIDCTTTKRVQMPNGMSSESCRGDVSNADFFSHRHCLNFGDIEHGKIGSRVCDIHRRTRYCCSTKLR